MRWGRLAGGEEGWHLPLGSPGALGFALPFAGVGSGGALLVFPAGIPRAGRAAAPRARERLLTRPWAQSRGWLFGAELGGDGRRRNPWPWRSRSPAPELALRSRWEHSGPCVWLAGNCSMCRAASPGSWPCRLSLGQRLAGVVRMRPQGSRRISRGQMSCSPRRRRACFGARPSREHPCPCCPC